MDKQTDARDLFCSDLSREAGESMIGTAATVEAWFLLEYPGPWGAKATEDNDLPLVVQEWLKEHLLLLGDGRLQFIKQERPAEMAGITFFVALSDEVEPSLYRFQLEAYEDLLALDVPALVSGNSAYEEFVYREHLYLVCTNGKRDRCCALKGPALYRGLVERVGDAAWQCTHLGGHRFAPTLVTFPGGVFYGRLTPAGLDSFVKSQEQGELYLENLRGRSCYDKVTQAAEHYLRQETGIRHPSAYRLLSQRRLDDKHWAVTFTLPGMGEIHTLTMAQDLSPGERLVSCSPLKSKPTAQFRLTNHEVSIAGN